MGCNDKSLSVSSAKPAGRWTDYATEKPVEAGWYEWSVPLRVAADVPVIFVAEFRERGAGYSNVLSPAFDDWDGYRVIVPAGTRWRSHKQQDYKNHREHEIRVEKTETATRCPLCGTTPKLTGLRTGAYGRGVVFPSHPHQYNEWQLRCCMWVNPPRRRTPATAVSEWNHLLAARSAAQDTQRERSEATPTTLMKGQEDG